MASKGPITIRDVAAAAGVSPMSVSKVLHGRGRNVRVSEETAEHIRQIATKLAYRPNLLARSFRQQRTQTIGLVFQSAPEFDSLARYHSNILHGTVSSAFGRGYTVALCARLVGDEAIATASDGRFDGLIWCRNAYDEEIQAAIDRLNLPVVVMHEPPPGRETTMAHVGWDNATAVRMAVDHLVELGHRKLRFAVSDYQLWYVEALLRFETFSEYCRSLGLDGGESMLSISKDGERLREWWSTDPETTALVAWSETTALEILGTAPTVGISMPDELSLIAFDSGLQCDYTSPRLTAIHQPIASMAERATEMLIDRIENPGNEIQHVVFPCRLDLRESTAAPRPSPSSFSR